MLWVGDKVGIGHRSMVLEIFPTSVILGWKNSLSQSIPLLSTRECPRWGSSRAVGAAIITTRPSALPVLFNHAQVCFPWLCQGNLLLKGFSLSKKFMREDENGVLLSELWGSAGCAAVLSHSAGGDGGDFSSETPNFTFPFGVGCIRQCVEQCLE